MRTEIFLAIIFFIAALSDAGLAASNSNFILEISSAGGGLVSSKDFSAGISSGEGLQGEASGSGFILSAGSQYFFSTDFAPQFFNLTESASTPKEGEAVVLSVDFVDDFSLERVIVSTNETGLFANETLQISGTEKHFDYTWNKQAKSGTTVSWKFFVSDSNGNWNETQEIFFFVGAIDKEAPKILSIKASPEKPAVGEQVFLEVEASDDFGLKGVIFEVAGKNFSEKILSGKSAKATHTFPAEGQPSSTIQWRAFVKDSSGKESVSETKSFTISSAIVTLTLPQQTATTQTTGATSEVGIVAGGCKLEEKPKPIEVPCANGKRKAYIIECKEGKWDVSEKEVNCIELPNIFGISEEEKEKNFAIIIIFGLVVLIIASAAYYYKKNPEKVKKLLEKIRGIFKRKEKPKEDEKEEKTERKKLEAKDIVVRGLKVPK